MAKTLSTTFNLMVSALHSLVGDLRTAKDPPKVSLTASLTDGTGANKADLLHADRYTLAASKTELDLTGGVSDVYGDAVTYHGVKVLLVYNRSTDAGEYLVVGGGTNPIAGNLTDGSDSWKVQPGGVFLSYAPDPADNDDCMIVVDGTSDTLSLDTTDSGATLDADVIVVGISA